MNIETDGIILDVDGTLWDSTDVAAASWQQAIDELNMKACCEITAEVLKGQFGKTMEAIGDALFPEEPPERRALLMERCVDIENDNLRSDKEIALYDGVAETIKKLSERVPMFVVSNCQAGYIEILIEKYNLQNYITDIECYGNNGLGKADNIELLAKRNGLKNPIYVGDTAGDKQACDEAGLPMVFCEYGFGKAEGCIASISKFAELNDIVS